MGKNDKWIEEHADSLDYADCPTKRDHNFDVSLLKPETQKAIADRAEEVKKEKAARAAKAKEKQKTGL